MPRTPRSSESTVPPVRPRSSHRASCRSCLAESASASGPIPPSNATHSSPVPWKTTIGTARAGSHPSWSRIPATRCHCGETVGVHTRDRRCEKGAVGEARCEDAAIVDAQRPLGLVEQVADETDVDGVDLAVERGVPVRVEPGAHALGCDRHEALFVSIGAEGAVRDVHRCSLRRTVEVEHERDGLGWSVPGRNVADVGAWHPARGHRERRLAGCDRRARAVTSRRRHGRGQAGGCRWTRCDSDEPPPPVHAPASTKATTTPTARRTVTDRERTRWER